MITLITLYIINSYDKPILYIGNYITIQMNGKNRVLGFNSVDVHTTEPTFTDPNNTDICFGIDTIDGTSIIPKYVISDDPEDPIFHSTCYYRENGRLWEDIGIDQVTLISLFNPDKITANPDIPYVIQIATNTWR